MIGPREALAELNGEDRAAISSIWIGVTGARSMQTAAEQTFLAGKRAALATAPAGEPTQLQVHQNAFWNKHGMPSMLPSSCFKCGHVGEPSTTHSELPNVYICKACVAAPPDGEVAALIERYRELAAKATPGPWRILGDDAMDCEPHRQSGLACIESLAPKVGKFPHWPAVRLGEWPTTELIWWLLTNAETVFAALARLSALQPAKETK